MRRPCLKAPIPEIFEAAEKLTLALQAHLRGIPQNVAELIIATDVPGMAAWTESIWGKSSDKVHGFRKLPDSPPYLELADRPVPRMPTRADRMEILQRDGFHCRFCGIPVIAAETRARIHALYPGALRWGSRNSEQHAAFQCMWLQFDHVLPNQRGGTSGPENVVITCAPCNFGRMEWTIEEARLLDPRERKLRPTWSGFTNWRGLEGF